MGRQARATTGAVEEVWRPAVTLRAGVLWLDEPGGRAEAAAARDRPELVEVRSPADGTPGPDDPIVLRFDEPVVIGRGCVRLVGEAGTVKIPVRDPSQVSVAGGEVTITPRTELAPAGGYELELGRSTFRDLDGNRLGELDPGLLRQRGPGGGGDAGAPATWTILVYMAADNDLERYALHDLAEMERVALPGSVELAALVDRSPWYVAGPGDFTDTRLGPVQPDGDGSRVGAGLVSIGERDTGDPATLTAFLDWAHEALPAERYGLVVWNHGAGLEGVAFDDSSRGDRLTLEETRLAIERSKLGRVDLLGFDACLMGMVEVASELRGVADVLVASEELVPLEGWAYDRILAGLARDPDADPATLASRIVESYAERYADRRDITLAAIDLGGLPRLEAALDGLADGIIEAPGSGALRALAAAAEDARVFPRDGSDAYRDLGGFLDALLERTDDPSIAGPARAARAALDDLLIAEAGTVEAASGLAIHLPAAGDRPAPGYRPADFAFLERVDWDGLIDQLVATG